MNKAVKIIILLLSLTISICGCGGAENSPALHTTEPLPDTAASMPPAYESTAAEYFPAEPETDFELLTQIFSMPYSEYSARKEDFAEITVKYYDILPESVMCYDFVIPESGVKCSAGMSYDGITGQLMQFSETRLVNYTIYNSGPHEYLFYENGNELKTAVEYYLNYTVDDIEKIYRFCFVFDNKNELSYIEIYYPAFNGINSMLNRRCFAEYSDICFKHIDDLTADDLSLLLNTKRSYIYSLYHFSSLELRSRIMDTFYYSAVGASPIVNTTIAYETPIEGEDWKEHLEECPLFILIAKGRLFGADISSDFSTVRKQWGEPLHEGTYDDKWRDKIVYSYMTYVFDDIMVVCVGGELNEEGDIIISNCFALPRDNELFGSDGVYISGL